jgi:hypothetical protein
MKPTVEWDENYVLNLPTGEHDWVEFKGTHLLDITIPSVDENKVLDELSKQLSAFANSGGGTLVYGVKDVAPGGLRTVDRGGVSSTLRGRSTKEWLEDVIPHLVEHQLMSFNVYSILKTGAGSNIDEGKEITLIEINDSEQAPHQARDKRYYARVGGKSRPIGHRMVLDILGRAVHPRLEISFSIREHLLHKRSYRIELLISCKNIGRVYAKYINGFIEAPKSLIDKHEEDQAPGSWKRTKLLFDNVHKDIVDVDLSLGGPRTLNRYVTRYAPLLPGLSIRKAYAMAIKRLDELVQFADSQLAWTVYADNMAPVEGVIRIGDIRVGKSINTTLSHSNE